MAVSTADEIITLTNRLAQIDARQDEMLECVKPSYNVDGQKFDWTQYQEFLVKWRAETVARLCLLDDIVNGAGFEVTQVDVA
jgi:hypothetical protein